MGGSWVHDNLHSDHLGSTVLVTNNSGAAYSGEGYYAYGRNRSGGIGLTDYKFTGQKRDGTGLQYFNARYYDPELGTFISPDTIVPDAGNLFDYNRYMFVRGNPLKYNDPTGHFTNDAIKEYLKQTHGDLWEEYWNLWSADSAWMDLMQTAAAGDIFASISTDSGMLSWHQFSGEGVTSLTGANEINLNGGETLGANVMLDVLRPGSNRTVAAGLLRAGADDSFQVVPTLPTSSSGLVLSLHNVGWAESLAWRGARAAGVTGIGNSVVWAAEKLSPLTAAVATVIGFATEFTIEEISDDLGYQQGDQQIRLLQLTTNYKGRSDTTQVGTWWYRPPSQSRFEGR